ncbi:hypothetical protein Salat_1464700 [Sesamum alatum]|uniref:Uncharacterized protein n=1 Tax=Sesamum alatum TaxID=300844 RepID=A0AAE1YBF5_9LAMI|nr:hypothetical protein Salat_1464700 [Sesamum alatum]
MENKSLAPHQVLDFALGYHQTFFIWAIGRCTSPPGPSHGNWSPPPATLVGQGQCQWGRVRIGGRIGSECCGPLQGWGNTGLVSSQLHGPSEPELAELWATKEGLLLPLRRDWPQIIFESG